MFSYNSNGFKNVVKILNLNIIRINDNFLDDRQIMTKTLGHILKRHHSIGCDYLLPFSCHKLGQFE